MAKLFNLARMTTSTTGTGTITLGSAVSGFLSFASAGVSDGDTVTYAIKDGSNSEIGRGVYTSSGTTLTRSVLRSTNSNSAINLSGSAEVFITAAAEDFASPVAPQGRLTLTSNVAVTTSDVTGATTVYYTPAGGQNVPIYDGAAWTMHDVGGQLSLALDNDSGHTNYHQSGKNFDFFYAIVSGVYYFGTGPKWNDGAGAGSDTARGTGAASTELELYNGFWVNKNSMTLRHGSSSGNTVTVPARQATYLGSGRMTANGQIDDTRRQRLLYNAYNRAWRQLYRSDPGISWTYSTNAWRQFNNSALNQVEILDGLGDVTVSLMVTAICAITTGSNWRQVRTCVGLDSTTTQATGAITGAANVNNVSTVGINSMTGAYSGASGIGYHFFAALELAIASGDTVTWYSEGAAAGAAISGLVGTVII